MNMTVFWLAAFIIFAVGEALTVRLVSVWFAVGALGAMAAAGAGGGLWVQVGVFLALSALSLLLFKPLSAKLLKPRASHTNADRVIGQTALVIQTVDNVQATGQVQVNGQVWTARSAHDVVIPQGSEVKILSIQGVKVMVESL